MFPQYLWRTVAWVGCCPSLGSGASDVRLPDVMLNLVLVGGLLLFADVIVSQIVCDENPCLFWPVRCCPTYPCLDPASTKPVLALSVFVNFHYGFREAVQVAVDDVRASGMFPDYDVHVRWYDGHEDTNRAPVAFLCTAFHNLSLAEPPVVPILIGTERRMRQ